MDVMDFTFIKDELKSMFNGLRVDKNALGQMFAIKENSFILNHNIDAVSSLLKFLDTTAENVFVLNGFMGAGKTSVTEAILDFLSEDVLVFKCSYQDAINLDDILLSLFKDFSVYHNEKKIKLPKLETNVFNEKINAYVKYCNHPMLFVFDSLEINFKSNEQRNELLGFIDYLSHFEKVKIIISSRSFRTEDLISSAGTNSFSLKSFTKEELEEYLKINNLEGDEKEIDSLLKVTRGHFLFIEFSICLMQLFGLTLKSFTNEYQKSTKNFIDFLVSRILNTASDKFIKSLLFLSSIRHSVSYNFLIMSQLASSDDIEFLKQKNILSEKFGKYYLKDYIKNEYSKNIDIKNKIRIHKYIIDLYESELPLKPFERNLFLSRQTMRQEISYHLSKLDSLQVELSVNEKPQINITKDFSYLSYSRSSAYDEKSKNALDNIVPVIIPQKNKEIKPKLEDVTVSHIASSSPVESLLNALPREIIKQHDKIVESKEVLSTNDFKVPDTIDDYIKIAQEYEDAYNYASAILYYKKALSYKSDTSYKEKEPFLYIKLADCYRKIQDVDSSVTAYEKVYSFYQKNDSQKSNEILLSIAKLYSETYNFEKAKEYYNRILNYESDLTSSFKIRVYIELSDLAHKAKDSNLAIKYMQKALNDAEKNVDVSILVECYFKYALLYDDMGSLDVATKYYLKCVQTSSNLKTNNFISSAYSNLAEIALDTDNYAAAKMYYELSIEADKAQNNNEGLYYSYLKLSQIYQKESPDKTNELLLKALETAKKVDDINYSVSAYIEIAEYYLKIKDYSQALKIFILAKQSANPNSFDGLYVKVIERINTIKNLLSESTFEQIINEMKK